MAVREDLGRDTAPRLQSQKFQSQANAFSFGEHSTCSSAVADTALGFVMPEAEGGDRHGAQMGRGSKRWPFVFPQPLRAARTRPRA